MLYAELADLKVFSLKATSRHYPPIYPMSSPPYVSKIR